MMINLQVLTIIVTFAIVQ